MKSDIIYKKKILGALVNLLLLLLYVKNYR
jgi:hypothetical protein